MHHTLLNVVAFITTFSFTSDFLSQPGFRLKGNVQWKKSRSLAVPSLAKFPKSEIERSGNFTHKVGNLPEMEQKVPLPNLLNHLLPAPHSQLFELGELPVQLL